ncbi:MAG: hypothetical protein WCC94_12725 [Candidatus Bathyarchaeia archaeon]
MAHIDLSNSICAARNPNYTKCRVNVQRMKFEEGLVLTRERDGQMRWKLVNNA